MSPDSEIRVRFVYAQYHEMIKTLPLIVDQNPISDAWFGTLRWRVYDGLRRTPLAHGVRYMAMEASVLSFVESRPSRRGGSSI